MIEFQQKTLPAAAIAACLPDLTYTLDENEAMQDQVQRLVRLIEDALPVAASVADLEAAEDVAAKIIRHLTIFESAWFGRRRTKDWLYGLSMAGVSTSSTTCRYILLRNWQRAARMRMGVLS